MHPDEDLPPFLDGWDELSTALDDEPELAALSRLGWAVDGRSVARQDGLSATDGAPPPF